MDAPHTFCSFRSFYSFLVPRSIKLWLFFSSSSSPNEANKLIFVCCKVNWSWNVRSKIAEKNWSIAERKRERQSVRRYASAAVDSFYVVFVAHFFLFYRCEHLLSVNICVCCARATYFHFGSHRIGDFKFSYKSHKIINTPEICVPVYSLAGSCLFHRNQINRKILLYFLLF